MDFLVLNVVYAVYTFVYFLSTLLKYFKCNVEIAIDMKKDGHENPS